MARSLASASTQYLKIDSAIISTTPFAISLWFYPLDVTNSYLLAAVLNGGSDTNYWSLEARGSDVGDPINAVSRNSTYFPATSTAGYTANAWHHACGVWSSSTSRSAYINGGNKGTDTNSSTPSSITRFALGALYRFSSTGTPFNGRIAEAALWNVALTDDEVAALYNNGIGLSPKMVRPDALVSYWPLLQTDGDIDWWGQNNLTAVNSPTYADHNPVIYPGGIYSIPTTVAAPAAASPNFLTLLGVGA